MKINAHINSAEMTSEFVAWLQNETCSAFERSRGAPEELKASVFLYLNRAYESGLLADEIADLLGVGDQSIMSRASLSKEDEESVLAAFAELDALVEQIHANPLQKWKKVEHVVTGEVKGQMGRKAIALLQEWRELHLETIVWENGADLAPEFLYDNMKISA